MPRHALLVPDLPTAAELLPFLERIDRNRQYSNFGPLVHEFEAALGAWVGQGNDHPVHAVTVSNGTTALELPLAALGLRAGARVLVPSLTFPASALAVLRIGLRPVFGDVDPHNWQLTPAQAEGIDCDAVMPVATYGPAVDTGAWDRFTAATGRPVIVDAASALGQQGAGRTTAVAFSLHATKPFGCGEGGLVATSNESFAQAVRRLSNFGFENKRAVEVGTNAKMSEYAAAVGLAQLARRQHLSAQRQRIWNAYRQALSQMPGVTLQANPLNQAPSVLCVALDQPVEPVQERLAAAGIETRRWYCPPLHEHPALAGCERANDLPVTCSLAQRLLGLPFHHHLAEADIVQIAAALQGALSA